MVVVEGGPYVFVGMKACVISLVTSTHPFDLHKVSWANRPEEQKRLDKGD